MNWLHGVFPCIRTIELSLASHFIEQSNTRGNQSRFPMPIAIHTYRLTWASWLERNRPNTASLLQQHCSTSLTFGQLPVTSMAMLLSSARLKNLKWMMVRTNRICHSGLVALMFHNSALTLSALWGRWIGRGKATVGDYPYSLFSSRLGSRGC